MPVISNLSWAHKNTTELGPMEYIQKYLYILTHFVTLETAGGGGKAINLDVDEPIYSVMLFCPCHLD